MLRNHIFLCFASKEGCVDLKTLWEKWVVPNCLCKVIMIVKLPHQSCIKMVDWSAENETYDLPFSTCFGYWPHNIFWGVVAFQRPVDSPTPRWNILRYLPTTMCGLTKNSKNYQAPLTQVRHHIVSSQEDIAIRRDRTDYYRKSFGFTGAKIWNVLPNNMKSELSFETFRNKRKSLYLSIDI